MFWGSPLAPPNIKTHLETILDAEKISLDEVLDDPLTLQEIRNGNEKLLKFFTLPDTIIELLNGALLPKVDESLPQKDQYRRAYQCTEVLSLASDEMCCNMLVNDSSSEILTEFFRIAKLNNLIVSFYAKIITHLLDKQCEKLLQKLKSSDFFALCLKNMRYSAGADLLFQISNVPKEFGTQDFVRQWYTENHLADCLCELMSPDEDTLVHNNVSYLWCELLTTSRENQYQCPEERKNEKLSDPLLESLQSKESLCKLLKHMLPATLEKRSDSVIANVAAILVALLETNYIPDRPSFLLGLDEKVEQSHFGREHARGDGDYDVWLPDPERVIELNIADYVDSLIDAILDSLEAPLSDLEIPSVPWFHLMQVFVQLLNTNYGTTHESILKKFSSMPSNPFQSLLLQVPSHPLLTLYQVYLSRCIRFILNTVPSPKPSPLIRFLLEDSKLLKLIVNLHEELSSNQLEPLCKKALRGFYLTLALAVHQTRIDSPNQVLIQQIIRESDQADEWDGFINGAVQKFEEENPCSEPSKESVAESANIEDEVSDAVVHDRGEYMRSQRKPNLTIMHEVDGEIQFESNNYSGESESEAFEEFGQKIPERMSDCEAPDISPLGINGAGDTNGTERLNCEGIANGDPDDWPSDNGSVSDQSSSWADFEGAAVNFPSSQSDSSWP